MYGNVMQCNAMQCMYVMYGMVCIHIGMVAINPSEDIWIDLPMMIFGPAWNDQGPPSSPGHAEGVQLPCAVDSWTSGAPWVPWGPRRGGFGYGWYVMVRVGYTRPGKHTKNYGTSPCLMGKSTISMGHFQ